MIRVELNPDDEFVAYIRSEIKKNNKHCISVPEKTKDTKCKCKAFREMISRGEIGFCDCGLYQIIDDGE